MGFIAFCGNKGVGQNRSVRPSYAALWAMDVVDAHVPTPYIAESLYSRHGNEAYYIRDNEDMNKTLYELRFMLYIITTASQVNINMTDIKAEVAKSSELQGRSFSTSLSHMLNRRKESKYVFRNLGYDIEIYTKFTEDIMKLLPRQQEATDINSDTQTAGSLQNTPRRARTLMNGTRSQNDDSKIVHMQNYKDSLVNAS